MAHPVFGAVAQLGERRLCKPEVTGSIPVSSTESALIPSGCSGVTRFVFDNLIDIETIFVFNSNVEFTKRALEIL